jgi:hypothetical protein
MHIGQIKKIKKIHICIVKCILNFSYAYPYAIMFWKIFRVDNLNSASNLHIQATLVFMSVGLLLNFYPIIKLVINNLPIGCEFFNFFII